MLVDGEGLAIDAHGVAGIRFLDGDFSLGEGAGEAKERDTEGELS